MRSSGVFVYFLILFTICFDLSIFLRFTFSYVINEDVNSTGISFFAIFDGHGGEFAAVFAKDHLVENLFNKITDTSHILTGKVPPPSPVIPRAKLSEENDNAAEDTTSDKVTKDDKLNGNDDKLSLKTTSAQRRSSFKKSLSTADDANGNKANANRDQDAFLNKLNSIVRTKDSLLKTATNNVKPQQYEAKCYIDKDRNINFGKMITDEVLAADYKLIEKAKKEASQMKCLNSVQSIIYLFPSDILQTNVAGTTALIAVIHKTQLIVANVGDSRGVMCDGKGNAIPLSFDHKPQQTRELKRIQEAGGFIAFKGVWRVAGILATSRALGDYPLKEKNLVIAEPDILTFELKDHK